MTASKPRAAGGDAGLPAARNQTPAEWLEADYDQPDAFREPQIREIHAPSGLYQIKPNHIGDCHCETSEGEYWLSGSAAMKWRGGSH